jgi:hypothetical protein
MGKKLLPALILLIIWPISGAGRPRPLPPVKEVGAGPAPAVGAPGVFSTAAVETTWFGGTVWNADSSRWEAIPGGTWTFDSGVGSSFQPPAGSCKDPSFHSRMEGWTSLDMTTSGVESRFRRLTVADFAPGMACVGSDAGLGGNASAWAGLLQSEADSLCWVSGQGYGNDWYVCLEKTFSTTGGDSVDLAYDFTNDTEFSFDYGRVLVDTTGAGSAPDLELVRYTGTVSASHAAWTLVPGATLPGGPGPYTVKFCATSDGAYSDEDGFNPTACGAFAVDDIAVSGGGVSDLSDFETGDDGWTEVHPCKGAGDFADIRDLSDLPAIPGSTGPCDLSDSVLVFFDPETGGHPLYQDNVAVSPWIDLGASGLATGVGVVIQADFYADLPIQNYVFATVFVQWYPDTCSATGRPGTSPLVSAPTVYWLDSQNAPNCSGSGVVPWRVAFPSTVTPGATRMRIALGVVNYCHYYGDCTYVTNPTPWFDNVRVGAYTPPPDIQDLIDAAAPGDTVRVSAWIYTGPRNRDLDFHGKNLVLLGEGANGTIIDCEGLGRGFLFHSGEDSTSVVQGVTVRAGTAPVDSVSGERYGGGVWLTADSTPKFVSCRFESCEATRGGGLAVAAPSSGPDSLMVALVDCVVNNCRADDYGGGVFGDLHTSIRIRGGALTDNTAHLGGGLYSESDSVLVENAVISGNQATSYGGGVYLGYYGTLRTCTFTGNTAGWGGGLYCSSPSQWGCSGHANLEHCAFSGNLASYGAGAYTCGWFWHDCTFEGNVSSVSGGGGAASYGAVHDCRFLDNQAGAEGGGLWFNTGTLEGCDFLGNVAGGGGGMSIGNGYLVSSYVTGCRFTGNKADQGGGVDFAPGSDNVSFDHCTFAGNSAQFGGGIFVNESAQPTIRYSIVSGNCADSLGAAVYTQYPYSTADFTCSALDSSEVTGLGSVTYTGPQVFTNPVFCDPAFCGTAPTTDGDYHLAANSPCLPAASPCDTLIGALGEGCATVGVPGEKPPVVTRPLLAVFPNPFTGSLRIQYAVPEAEPPRLRIYTIAGRLVRELNPTVASGVVTWDGRDTDGVKPPAGVYFVKMAGSGGGTAQRVVLLR